MSLVFPHSLYDQTDTANLPTGQPLVTLGHVRENAVLRSSPAESPSKASELLSTPHETSQVPVVDISQIQKYKTKEICSLPARPDFDFADLQMWLTLDAESIQRESFVEDILHHQELHDNFLELVLESSTPFLVSVRYAGAFQKYASRKRSEDMRMADAADEKAAALEQLACAIAREENFASLLISSSKFRDLKDDASIAKNLFYREVTDALQLATWFKLKSFVSEPLIAALVRNQWYLARVWYKLSSNLTVYKLSPALRYWLHQISYIIFCVLAWFLKPGVTDDTGESGVGITNQFLEGIVWFLAFAHVISCYCRVGNVIISTTETKQRTPWKESSKRRKLRKEALERRKLVKVSSEFSNLSGCFTGDDERDDLRLQFYLFAEVTFTCVALTAVSTRELQNTTAADVYLFFMVMWWGRLVTILQVFRFSGPLLCIVQACFMDIIRFIVLVIFIMLPFVAGLSQRFRNSNFAAGSETFYTRNATGFETFALSGGSFMKMFVDAGKGPALDDSKDDTYVLGLSGLFIVWAAYVFLVIILLNLLIAMFSKTFDIVYENADREYFLKRAELLFEWKQATVCPPPFNVIEDICKIFKRAVRDIQRDCQKHMIADEEEDIPDAGNTAPDEFTFDKDFIVPPEERREWIHRVLKDFEENRELGTEQQLSQFKHVVLKGQKGAATKVASQYKQLEAKIDAQQKLLEKLLEKV